MTDKKIAIIGCGNLGMSIARGMLDSGIKATQITATRRKLQRLEPLKETGITLSDNNSEAISNCDIIILAVKPYNVDDVLRESAPALTANHVLISVATGIELGHLRAATSEKMPVFRAMPNTATDVGQSVTTLCHQDASPEQIKLVESLFGGIGSVITISEHLMEAATVLGACGIAYVMRFIRAMVQGGIEIGFDAKTASDIVNQTVKGAAELLISRGEHPEYEIDKVTTPKGCTIVGLNEMEHNGFSSSLIKGITTSYQKIEK